MGCIITYRNQKAADIKVFDPFECVLLKTGLWSLRQEGRVIGHTEHLLIKGALYRVVDGRKVLTGHLHHGPEDVTQVLGYRPTFKLRAGTVYPFVLLRRGTAEFFLNPEGLTRPSGVSKVDA